MELRRPLLSGSKTKNSHAFIFSNALKVHFFDSASLAIGFLRSAIGILFGLIKLKGARFSGPGRTKDFWSKSALVMTFFCSVFAFADSFSNSG